MVASHRLYSTNSVKPKPGTYAACGQRDRNLLTLCRNEDCRLNYKTKTKYKTEIKYVYTYAVR